MMDHRNAFVPEPFIATVPVVTDHGPEDSKEILASDRAVVDQPAIGQAGVTHYSAGIGRVDSRGQNASVPAPVIFDDQRPVFEPVSLMRQETPRVKERAVARDLDQLIPCVVVSGEIRSHGPCSCRL